MTFKVCQLVSSFVTTTSTDAANACHCCSRDLCIRTVTDIGHKYLNNDYHVLALNGPGPLTSVSASSPISGTRSNIQGTAATSVSSVSRFKTSPSRPLMSSSSSLIKSSHHGGNYSYCLPSDYDVIVYRAEGGGNASEFIQVFQRIHRCFSSIYLDRRFIQITHQNAKQ